MTHPDQPSSISRYKVISRLDGWSIGESYKAFDPLLERHVIVERYSLAGVPEEQAIEVKRLFYREMQRVGALTHPNAARLFDAGEAADGLFVTWEHVEGTNLEGFLHGGSHEEPAVWLKWLRQTAGALDGAHLKGMTHLNLTPASVLLDLAGNAKVIGFGIAPVVDLLSKTQRYQWAPSSYEAPERAAGAVADARADWYSFAAVVREVVRRGLGHEPSTIRDQFERALVAEPAARPLDPLGLLLAVETELGALGLLAPGDDGEPASSDSVTAVFNRIIDADRPGPAAQSPAVPTGASTVPAPASAAAPAKPAARIRSSASPWILLAATALVCAVAAVLSIIWLRSPMWSDLWYAMSSGSQDAPASGAPAPAVPAIEAPPANAVPPQAPAAATVPTTVESNSGASVSVASGMLRIVTQPEGAAVTVDGESRGVSPVRVDRLSLGAHSVSASLTGYSVARQSVQLTRESPARTIGLTLAPATPVTGILRVSTVPAGATLILDDRRLGTTPVQLDVTVGRHTLRVEQDGYAPVSRDIEIAAGQPAVVVALTLQSAPSPTSTSPAFDFERVTLKPRQVSGTTNPPYPPVARLSRSSGMVVLGWVVDAQGRVTDVEIVEASAKVFETAVLAWIRDVRYEPGQQDGRAVPVKIVRRFRFEFAR